MSSFWNDDEDDMFDLPPDQNQPPEATPGAAPAPADDPVSIESTRMFDSIYTQGSEVKPVQRHVRMIRYYEIATDLAKKGAEHERKWKQTQNAEDLTRAYIFLLRAVHYVIAEIPKHPQYNSSDHEMDKKIFRQHTISYMNKLEVLKPAVQVWCRTTAQAAHNATVAAQLAAKKPAPRAPPPPPDEPYPEPARVQELREAELARGLVQGRQVLYKPALQVVTVTSVHLDDIVPYYTVTNEQGEERQTTGDKLEMLPEPPAQEDAAADSLPHYSTSRTSPFSDPDPSALTPVPAPLVATRPL